MATTTNYSWTTPDDTALVKDGAAAIRTLGSSIDTTTKNLNPSTTLGDLEFRSSTANVNTRIPIGSSGQHLTVVAGVPAWATASDQTPLTTKGDLFTFSTLDARIGVGANDTVLTADSAEATGLKWATPASGGMTLISTTAITSTATINLSSIPQTYNNLVVIVRNFMFDTAPGDYLQIRFNADQTSNRYLTAAGVVTSQNTAFNENKIIVGSGQNDQSTTSLVVIQIPDYTNTATIKMAFVDSVENNATTSANINYKRNVGFFKADGGAISAINLFGNSTNFYPTGTILLYGVK